MRLGPGRLTFARLCLVISVMVVSRFSAVAQDKPFFHVDPNATGPLTLSELQIHIPAKIADHLTEGGRKCYLAAIGERVAQAGDPEKADPVKLGYLPSGHDWKQLGAFGRRLILAQAIVSRAIINCAG